MPVLFDFSKQKDFNKKEIRKRNIKRIHDNEVHMSSEEAIERLDDIANNSSRTIFTLKTVFPFTLFPDVVSLDIEKISIISREFFASDRIQSIMLANISDIYIDSSPFFGALKIVDKFFVQNVITVRYLKKDEAIMLRKLAQGLIVAQRQHVDVSKIPHEELIPRLEEIGAAA
ncbi:MAG TPA: hypothetical protein VG917_03515 [Patescibacteria group bacterium]|nr:hypothetical protein [Patescibacteria group bacterium]